MQHPAVCPICSELGDIICEEFHEFYSIIEHDYSCPTCDSEWKVPFVMVEKVITKDGQETS